MPWKNRQGYSGGEVGAYFLLASRWEMGAVFGGITGAQVKRPPMPCHLGLANSSTSAFRANVLAEAWSTAGRHPNWQE